MDWKKPTAEQMQQFDASLPDDPRMKRAMMFGLPHGKVGDHMFAGRHGTGVTVRAPPEDKDKLLAQGCTIFEPFPGKQMKDWILLTPAIAQDARALSRWVRRAFDHTAALPPKGKAKTAAKAKASKPKPRTATQRSKRA